MPDTFSGMSDVPLAGNVSVESSATPSGSSFLHSVQASLSSPFRSQDSTCRSFEGSVGSMSISVAYNGSTVAFSRECHHSDPLSTPF